MPAKQAIGPDRALASGRSGRPISLEGGFMARREDFRRIGLLLPSSNSVQEPDFCGVLPKHITLHVARMRLSQVEADSTLRIVEEIETESLKLADVDVDVIVLAA